MPPWTPGRSGNPSGRPPGTKNRATVEGRTFARQLVDSPRYRRELRERVRTRELHPTLERELWHFAWGVPRLGLDVDVTAATVPPFVVCGPDGLPEDVNVFGVGTFTREADGRYAFEPHAPAGGGGEAHATAAAPFVVRLTADTDEGGA